MDKQKEIKLTGILVIEKTNINISLEKAVFTEPLEHYKPLTPKFTNFKDMLAKVLPEES